MSAIMGTPKTLREAVKNGLYLGAANEATDRVVSGVIDLLAQRFGAMVLSCKSRETEAALIELFKRIKEESRK